MKRLSIPMSRKESICMWCYLFFEMFVLPTALYLCNTLLPSPLNDTGINIIYFVINFLVTVVVCRNFLKKSIIKAVAHPFALLKAAFFGFLLYYAASFVVTWIILILQPNYINANDASISVMSQDNYAFISLCTVFLVPPVEEILYRGLIFRGLHSRSRFLAYAVSSLVFSAVHVTGYIGFHDPLMLALSLLQYIPAGLCLAWAYEKADTIAAPILLHMTINQIAMMSMR